MSMLASLLMLAGGGPAVGPILPPPDPAAVKEANKRWDKLPALALVSEPMADAESRTRFVRIAEHCKLSGSVEATYAVLLLPGGQLRHISVQPHKCAALETLVADVAASQEYAGKFVPPGGSMASWHRGTMTFTN